MTVNQIRLILCVVLLSTGGTALGQFLTITDIVIEGNKRTKEHIILRELEFKVGDQVQQSQLAAFLTENEFNLLASTLFTQVHMNIQDWDVDAQEVVVKIEVKEAPVIVPIPIFELADRNFNVWWNEFNASLKRVNYGLKMIVFNPTGHGERFKLTAQFGYTPAFDFSALLPFLDNNQSVRLELKALYTVNKQVAIINRDNKKIFAGELGGDVIFKRQHYKVGLLFRPKIYATHAFRVGYNNSWINRDTMLNNNPDFFLDERTTQEFIFAEYEFGYDRRDLPIMSTSGYYIGLRFYKDGFGFFNDISATYFVPRFEYFHTLAPKLTASLALEAKIGLERSKQPYYNYRGLGYKNSTVRGYELYVADALDYYIGKVTLQYEVWESQIKWSKFLPIQDMPFRVAIAANYDLGYANDPFYNDENSFTNSVLTGGGLGVNALFYNTILFRVECSINHLGQKGVFLHSSTAF